MRNHTLKIIAVILLGVLIACLCLAIHYFLSVRKTPLLLAKTRYSRLPAWSTDKQSQALAAFKLSCEDILKRDPHAAFSTLPLSGNNFIWQKICASARQVPDADDNKARTFFETWFEPYQVRTWLQSRGIFTSYYLPVLHGSFKNDARFTVPVYAPPNDLVKIQLGLFRPDLAGTVLIAQEKNHELLPYPDRAAINQGAINKNAPILLWCDNALDVFFAQIQGSARVELPNHQSLLIHYAGSNGRPYTAIGNILIAKKALAPQNISMQSIRAWLEQHPEQSDAVLNQNAAYVFFSVLNKVEPYGSEAVTLTPGRSLAVDTHVLPLGAPMWLETSLPAVTATPVMPFNHLLIAQDTGGAIRGVIRGDIYWGSGAYASDIAGHMQSSGKYWILLPRSDIH